MSTSSVAQRIVYFTRHITHEGVKATRTYDRPSDPDGVEYYARLNIYDGIQGATYDVIYRALPGFNVWDELRKGKKLCQYL